MSSEGSAPDPPVEITNLRLSRTANLLGVDDKTPSISWSYSVPGKSAFWRQQTYILAIRSWSLLDDPDGVYSQYEATFAGPTTSRSENVPWPTIFPSLRSGRVYQLAVMAVLTRSGEPEAYASNSLGTSRSKIPIKLRRRHATASPPPSPLELAEKFVKQLDLGPSETSILSATLRFEAGLIGGMPTWYDRAPRITPISTPWDLQNWQTPKPVAVFRNKYRLPSKPRAARLHATAFGVYRVFINGKPVGNSIMEPGWTEYTLRLLYQTYDITDYLQEGENVVTVFVADGWYRGRLSSGWEAQRGFFGKETGFMALIRAYYGNNGYDCFETGRTGETGWRCTKASPILESGIYDGECYDSRVDIDALSRKEWEDVKPMLSALTWNSPTPVLQASTAPPVRCTETLTLRKVIKSPAGKKILDFGQNTAGRIRMKGSAPAGTKVTFVHVEVLLPDGVEEWEPEFTFHGFRYVQVDPWIEGLDVVVKVYGSDLTKGLVKFQSSHAELNRLVENIRWSARANFLSVCTDCPQRDERLGWTGDVNAFGPTATYIFDCQTFLSSWLHGLVDGQKIGGHSCPPLVSPNCLHPPGSHRPTALWQDVLVTLPWHLYEVYGDTSLLNDLFHAMVEYHNNGIPKDPATGLWRPTYQFGDWLDPSAPPGRPDLPATDPMYVANTWLCHITNTLVKIAVVLKKADQISFWSSHASELTSQWQAKYLVTDQSKSSTADGHKTPAVVLNQDTQTAHSLALNFHLLPTNLVGPAIKRLHHLVERNGYHLATGFAGTPELLHAISYRQPSSHANLASLSLAYRVLLEPHVPPSWLYPVTMGATSIWERWDAVLPDGSVNTPGMTSLNHYAYGSVGRWIFENIGGIRIARDDVGDVEKGWRVIFDPVPNLAFGVTNAEMVYDSPKGKIECRWEYSILDKTMDITVILPANCEGEVRVLGKTAAHVGGGKWHIVQAIEEQDWRHLEAYERQVRDGSSGYKNLQDTEEPGDEWVII
ncbi:Alpha-L-rhamnosidase [Drechslerella dactyloides]|uniref:alpha-L-rhamnosidase n=1 Tax=Drechslerella dactyloides TaxID=74499 RepID=A0AAD6NFS5_DREDA|nr:Alpha-L-rhamnosidase [Drechslerella dactyloides]